MKKISIFLLGIIALIFGMHSVNAEEITIPSLVEKLKVSSAYNNYNTNANWTSIDVTGTNTTMQITAIDKDARNYVLDFILNGNVLSFQESDMTNYFIVAFKHVWLNEVTSSIAEMYEYNRYIVDRWFQNYEVLNTLTIANDGFEFKSQPVPDGTTVNGYQLTGSNIEVYKIQITGGFGGFNPGDKEEDNISEEMPENTADNNTPEGSSNSGENNPTTGTFISIIALSAIGIAAIIIFIITKNKKHLYKI